MESKTVVAERAYEKHAWILLFALGMVAFFFAFISVFSGTPDPDTLEIIHNSGTTWEELSATNPGVANAFRFLVWNEGLFLLGTSVFTMAITLKSYRRGEKWAWYVLWYLPVSLGIITALILAAVNRLSILFPIFLVISLLGLLLPYRKFFPKKQAVNS